MPRKWSPKLGDTVEVSPQDEGFLNCWFKAHLLKLHHKKRVYIEYCALFEDEDGSQRQKEVLNIEQIRPLPPEVDPKVEEGRIWHVGDCVEALIDDGWWKGVIDTVCGNDTYMVRFLNGVENEISEAQAESMRTALLWTSGQDWACIRKEDQAFLQMPAAMSDDESPRKSPEKSPARHRREIGVENASRDMPYRNCKKAVGQQQERTVIFGESTDFRRRVKRRKASGPIYMNNAPRENFSFTNQEKWTSSYWNQASNHDAWLYRDEMYQSRPTGGKGSLEEGFGHHAVYGHGGGSFPPEFSDGVPMSPSGMPTPPQQARPPSLARMAGNSAEDWSEGDLEENNFGGREDPMHGQVWGDEARGNVPFGSPVSAPSASDDLKQSTEKEHQKRKAYRLALKGMLGETLVLDTGKKLLLADIRAHLGLSDAHHAREVERIMKSGNHDCARAYASLLARRSPTSSQGAHSDCILGKQHSKKALANDATISGFGNFKEKRSP